MPSKALPETLDTLANPVDCPESWLAETDGVYAPEESSVTLNVTTTVADASVVSTLVVDSDQLTSIGAVVSADVDPATVNAEVKAAPGPKDPLFPVSSSNGKRLIDHVPGALPCGTVIVAS